MRETSINYFPFEELQKCNVGSKNTYLKGEIVGKLRSVMCFKLIVLLIVLLNGLLNGLLIILLVILLIGLYIVLLIILELLLFFYRYFIPPCLQELQLFKKLIATCCITVRVLSMRCKHKLKLDHHLKSCSELKMNIVIII